MTEEPETFIRTALTPWAAVALFDSTGVLSLTTAAASVTGVLAPPPALGVHRSLCITLYSNRGAGAALSAFGAVVPSFASAFFTFAVAVPAEELLHVCCYCLCYFRQCSCRAASSFEFTGCCQSSLL